MIELFRNFTNSTYNREGAYNRVMRVHTFQNCEFSYFQNNSDLRGLDSEQIVSNWSNFENKNIQSLKTVHPRQISLAEVRGNKRFFLTKSVV